MKLVKIGVLGGIGPEASAAFYLKLIKRLQSGGSIRENADFPQLFINSIPAPELIGSRIDDRELEWYIRGLGELDRMEPDFILMVCNTIHLFYDRLRQGLKAELLDLRALLRSRLERDGLKRITVMGTPSTVASGLYAFPGIRLLNPDAGELERLSRALGDFNRGFQRESQIELSLKVARKYLGQGSQAVILGCTEFAVMLESADLPSINTIDLLVEGAVERYLKLRAA